MTSPNWWNTLLDTPLFWTTLTIAASVLADRISARLGRPPLANPVMIAVAIVIALLSLTGVPFDAYARNVQVITFLLGPATVALAVPLYRHWPTVRQAALPIGVSLLVGSSISTLSAVAIVRVFGAPYPILASIAPKSATSPISMEVARRLGGDPSLTAALVIVTGVFGAIVAVPLFRLLRIRDERARGFAMGLASHGIGAARAFQLDAMAGTFAGIGMALNGLATAVFAPMALHLVERF